MRCGDKAVGTGQRELSINLSLKKKALSKKRDVYAYKFIGKRYDAGDKQGYVKAIIDSALEREDLRGEIEKYLRKIVAGGEI